MSTLDPASPPPIGRLFAEGLQHWLDHQRLFWALAAPFALLLGGLRFAVVAGWVKTGEPTGLLVILYAIVLNHWFKNMLYDDWARRAALLARDRKTRRSGSVASLPVMIFCAAYGLAIFIPAFLVLIGVGNFGRGQEGLLLIAAFAIQSVTMIVMAVPFGSFSLYLPARSAGLPWGLGEAYRAAEGVRGRLVALALLCTVMSIAGALTVVVASLARLPDGPWFGGIGRALVVIVDLLALYVLAYGTGRLFAVSTGWKPDPLPS